MAELDDYPCHIDGCDKAYPHSLLKDFHIVQEHPEYLDAIIEGESIDMEDV